jgi:hypothetical protein
MKQPCEIDAEIRVLATRRDQLLAGVPTLSRTRRAALNKVLIDKFPVEMTLRDVASDRDRLLAASTAIPVSVASTLQHQLVTSIQPIRSPGWQRIFRRPVSAGLAACAVIGAAILWLGEPASRLGRNQSDSPRLAQPDAMDITGVAARSPIANAELFSRKSSIRRFNLDTNEPASLQPSFLANSSLSFADGKVAALGLRLDLPVRAILTEDGLARTP